MTTQIDIKEIHDGLSGNLAGRDININYNLSLEASTIVMPIEKQSPPRVTVHRGVFVNTGLYCYFINVANLLERDIEVTHVWFDCQPQIHALQPSRPLPKRLKPAESWETWIEFHKLPNHLHKNPYNLARVRLSTGQILISEENKDVPQRGSVPGGPITLS